MRKFELFQKNIVHINRSFSLCPPSLFRQERDWTCAFACIRTMMSAFDDHWLSEDEIVSRYHLTPQPYFSADIKRTGLLGGMDVVCGCDRKANSFDDIVALVADGYQVMLESLINYSHWMVLTGCYSFGDGTDPEMIKLALYDPYYHDIKVMLLDEFINVWIDAETEANGIEQDYLAFKKK